MPGSGWHAGKMLSDLRLHCCARSVRSIVRELTGQRIDTQDMPFQFFSVDTGCGRNRLGLQLTHQRKLARAAGSGNHPGAKSRGIPGRQQPRLVKLDQPHLVFFAQIRRFVYLRSALQHHRLCFGRLTQRHFCPRLLPQCMERENGIVVAFSHSFDRQHTKIELVGLGHLAVTLTPQPSLMHEQIAGIDLCIISGTQQNIIIAAGCRLIINNDASLSEHALYVGAAQAIEYRFAEFVRDAQVLRESSNIYATKQFLEDGKRLFAAIGNDRLEQADKQRHIAAAIRRRANNQGIAQAYAQCFGDQAGRHAGNHGVADKKWMSDRFAAIVVIGQYEGCRFHLLQPFTAEHQRHVHHAYLKIASGFLDRRQLRLRQDDGGMRSGLVTSKTIKKCPDLHGLLLVWFVMYPAEHRVSA